MAEPDKKKSFKDAEEEYAYHLIRAEHHIRHALAMVAQQGVPNRSALCQTLLRRTHGVVLGLYIQESQNQKKKGV